jgi:hypothetical protein
MMPDDYGKILEQVGNVVPLETKILAGWICDEKQSETVKL